MQICPKKGITYKVQKNAQNIRKSSKYDLSHLRSKFFFAKKASFQKLCPGIKTPKEDELIILGSPLGPKSQADLSEKKIN